jgi:hypothetical protein
MDALTYLKWVKGHLGDSFGKVELNESPPLLFIACDGLLFELRELPEEKWTRGDEPNPELLRDKHS